jgi:hypothetical protein
MDEKKVVDVSDKRKASGYTVEEKDAKRAKREEASAEYRKDGRRDPFRGSSGLNTDISQTPSK